MGGAASMATGGPHRPTLSPDTAGGGGASRTAVGAEPARRRRVPPVVAMLAALAVVLGVAAALRWPHLQRVPHVTDESAEVLFARAIAFDGARPLTHADAYDGPWWPYLLAAVFRVAGSSVALPRLFTFGLGLAAVAATFALGAQLARPGQRPAAAGVAGLLLATHFTHAVVDSRVAWSNATSPLWTTLAVLALVAAVRGRSTPGFAVAGILAGLALHTHPSVSVLLAALALWLVVEPAGRACFRTAGPWVGLGTALAAYSPVIVFNVREGFRSLAEAGASTNSAGDPTAGGWAGGVAAALAQLGRSMVGGFTLDGPAGGAVWAAAGGLALAAAAWGVVALARDRAAPPGRALPAVAVAVALAALPLFNRNWHGVLEARYLGFTWPLVYAAIGAAAARGWAGAGRAIAATGAGPTAVGAGRGAVEAEAGAAARGAAQRHPTARRIAVAAAVAALAALPAYRVARFDAAALAAQRDNRRLLAMTAYAAHAAAGGATVWVDVALKPVRWPAGGHPRRAVEYLLTLADVPFTQAPEAKINHFLDAGDDLVMFLAGPTAASLGGRHALTPIDAAPRPGEEAWGLYVGGGE